MVTQFPRCPCGGWYLRCTRNLQSIPDVFAVSRIFEGVFVRNCLHRIADLNGLGWAVADGVEESHYYHWHLVLVFDTQAMDSRLLCRPRRRRSLNLCAWGIILAVLLASSEFEGRDLMLLCHHIAWVLLFHSWLASCPGIWKASATGGLHPLPWLVQHARPASRNDDLRRHWLPAVHRHCSITGRRVERH